MFGEDDSPEIKLRKEFWDKLGDDRVVMLGLKGVEDDRTRPMTAQVDQPADDGSGIIYFFASKGEGVGESVLQGTTNRAVATFASKGNDLFAHIHGTLHASNDRGVIDRLWNPIVGSWYKDGKDDPNLLLLRLDAERADVWEASAFATLKAAAMKMIFDKDPGEQLQDEHQAEVQL
jgi:general stress protein 26